MPPETLISLPIASFAKITPAGIEFAAEAAPTFLEWDELGRHLVSVEKGVQFCMGDWLNFGEKKFGEKYSDALSLTGACYQTLRDYAWVASNVPLSARADKLSWRHHREVAKLEPKEQKIWLGRAIAGLEKGEPFGVKRLARSIEEGRVVDISEIARVNENKGIPCHILQINRLRAWLRDLKESGKLEELTERQRQAIREDFKPMEDLRTEMVELGLWSAEV